MNSPSHEEIATRAYSIWQQDGCPRGRDLDIWLNAERQLTGESARSGQSNSLSFVDRAREETAAESVVEYQITPAVEDQEAIKAAVPEQLAKPPRKTPRKPSRQKAKRTRK